MNDKGNRYALAALKDKRATLAGEIVRLENQIKYRKQSLVHVDAALQLLDPAVVPDAIRNKKPYRRVKLFRQGELGRLILAALRNSKSDMPTADIVTAILKAGGHGEVARLALAPRIRGNLAYLERRGMVRKIGDSYDARWRLC